MPITSPSRAGACCGKTPNSGGGTPGATCDPDDTVPVPPWTPACSGGGYTVTASDIVNSEDWSPQ